MKDYLPKISMTFDLERARGLRDFLQDDCAEVGDVWGEMIAEIERLRAENKIIADRAAHNTKQDAASAKLQAARIKELRAELASANVELMAAGEIVMAKDARIKELEGMLSIRTEELDIAHSVARSEKEMHEKELAAFARRIKELEEAKPRSWQITEERKAAIWHAVAVLKENDPDDEHLWDEEIAVLRAMLTEAA